jgi:hypothetical protein
VFHPAATAANHDREDAMRAQEAFEEMLAEHIWPALKDKGFKRSKSTFHRPIYENWEVVNLQRSYYSDRYDVRFTVNVAVGSSASGKGS